MTLTTQLQVRTRIDILLGDVDVCLLVDYVRAHLSVSPVVSHCSDPGSDCTRSFTAWDFAFFFGW